jgi:hypothetical protein
MVAMPVVTEAVKTAVYVPLELSVTELSVPRFVLRTTFAPPDVRLPLASRIVAVTMEVDVPFAGSVFGLATNVEFAPDAGPCSKIISAVSTMVLPLSVPDITAGLPRVKIGLMNVAV